MIVRNKTLMTAISSVSPLCLMSVWSLMEHWLQVVLRHSEAPAPVKELSENICSNFDLKLVFRSKTSIAAMT